MKICYSKLVDGSSFLECEVERLQLHNIMSEFEEKPCKLLIFIGLCRKWW